MSEAYLPTGLTKAELEAACHDVIHSLPEHPMDGIAVMTIAFASCILATAADEEQTILNVRQVLSRKRQQGMQS